jgi:uncharacterized protein YjbJ (UPF0337 family)
MSIEDKIKAAAKSVEGKLEAAAGELTGDTILQTFIIWDLSKR